MTTLTPDGLFMKAAKIHPSIKYRRQVLNVIESAYTNAGDTHRCCEDECPDGDAWRNTFFATLSGCLTDNHNWPLSPAGRKWFAKHGFTS